MRKVHIVYISHAYAQMFLNEGWEIVAEPDVADVVCFTGGEDVSPSFYKESKHPRTFFNRERDMRESLIFQSCLDSNIPMVGICRGGQFLNVMSGGRMYQDVKGHTESHSITDLESGKPVFCSSTHHQMMRPSEEGVIVAACDPRGPKEMMEGDSPRTQLKYERDTEVVWYPKTKSLCFQPHPEFESKTYEYCRKYFFDCIERFIPAKIESCC